MTIPESWAWSTIGEISEINPPVSAQIPDDQLVTFVPMPSVEVATGRLDPTQARPWREVRTGFTRFEDGDVLFAKITPSMENGKAAIAEGLIGGRGAGSTEFHVLRPLLAAETKYLLHFILQPAFRREARARMKGVAGQLRVPPEFMREARIPVAPLAEQRRIVAAIEQQFTRLDAAVAALRRARANLKRYRAAVLKAACEGRLVPTEAELARAEGRAYESGAQLLERILAERRARWEAEQQEKYAKSGKQPPFNWRAKYEEPAAPDTSALPALPEGWCWVRSEQICGFITKGTTPTSDKLCGGNGEVPFIKVYNLTDRGVLNFGINPTYISRTTHVGDLARSKVIPDDVLMNIVGPPLGKVSIVPNIFEEWNINQAIAIFRPTLLGQSRFLAQCLLCESILGWAVRRAKATAGQFNLTLEICRDLPLPLPPLAEQQRIVAEVERRLSVLDQLEVAVEAGLKRAERLRQAILKRAFAGRLVPQDPADEPASTLLARIRAERGAEAAPAGGKRGRKRGGAGEQLSLPV